jgi:hypothetical protein
MRAREFLRLLEKKISRRSSPSSTNLTSLKSVILSKIKNLPTTQETINALEEVKDLLAHVNLGVSRRKASSTEFNTWNDADVQEAKDLLAKYVISLDQPIPLKRSMLAQWKDGGLIDVTLLITEGAHTIEQIVRGYSTNPAVKEFSHDLLQVSSLGKGKGEFMLKVLSPLIKNPPGGKGDIEIINFGTVEVKTTDGGAGRFYDRQVKAGPNYSGLASRFRKKYDQYFMIQPEQDAIPAPVTQPTVPTDTQTTSTQTLSQQPALVEKKTSKAPPKPIKLPTTGLNLDQLVTLYKKVPTDLQEEFKNDLIEILKEVFVEVPMYAESVVNFIIKGNSGAAKQLYGVGSLNNYMKHKTDKGILYIDLTTSPETFTFFTNNQSLNKGGLRLNISTVYPVSSNEQYAFPQTSIVKTGQEQPQISSNPTT